MVDRTESVSGPRRGAGITAWALAAVVALATLAVAATLDWGRTGELLRAADWLPVAPAIASTMLSYVALSLLFVSAARLVGAVVPWRRLLPIAFVAAALNRVVAFGGVAAHSFSVIALRRQRIAPGEALAISSLEAYTGTLAMVSLLPLGIALLLARGELRGPAMAPAALAAAMGGILVAAAGVALFNARVRRVLMRPLLAVVRRAPSSIGRPAAETIADLDGGLERTSRRARERPLLPARLLALAVVDWAAMLVTLGLSFEAMGDSIEIAVLVAGFAVGVNLGVLSLVPGGLGVQDASMAGAFSLLGVDLEHAVLSVGLFRVIYYVLPFVAVGPAYLLVSRQGSLVSPTESGSSHAAPRLEEEPRS